MRGSRDIWVIAVLFAVLSVAMFSFARPRQTPENKTASSYNSDPMGTKASYTLLGERLGYRVDRLTEPFEKMPRGAKVVVVVEPDSEMDYGEDDWRVLSDWVRHGGTLVYASRVPICARVGWRGFVGPSLGPHPLGRGRIYQLSSPRTINNRGMRDYRNAVAMSQLIAGSASKSELILFDEYHHGHTGSGSLLSMFSRPVKMSLVVFAIAVLLAVYGQGRRFGAVRQAEETETRRPGSEFVEAVGRLYRRAGATDVAADVMLDSFVPVLRRKLGVAPDTGAERIIAALGPESPAASLLRLRTAGQKPTERELLSATQDIQRLEKELGLERFHA